MRERFDVAVVGAGILGLAHAYHLARAGKRVIVLERHARAQGASVRNFGMIWPIGQQIGEVFDTALRSREIWHEVLADAGIWHERCGSLHLAYHDDEASVLREFAADPRHVGRGYELVSERHVKEISPWTKAKGLRVGLFSPAETCVDPRQVIAELPGYLASKLGVRFEFNTAVVGYDAPDIRTTRGSFSADHLMVCSGDEVQLLYPQAFAALGLRRCKLQMMRTQGYPAGERIGPMLAAGLTLLHYKSFVDMPTLPAVRARLEAELPDYTRHGIHVMASQTGKGEITIGDTHEYGDDVSIFNKEHLDDLVLKYLNSFFEAPGMRIAERWFGIYMKHPTQHWITANPEPTVTIASGVGGAGMTLSFGFAERVVKELTGSK